MNGERRLIRTMLEAGRVQPDSVLVVHSAFRNLSRTGLRAETVCEALLEEMVGGTILMPTMTWRTVTPANPIFSERATPSHTGALTEVFRTTFATHRSLHPTHSVAGCGPAAASLLSTHHHGTTPCPGTSPYGLMRDYSAFILLLGTGMESCTAIHHAEEVMAPDLYVQPQEMAEAYTLIDSTGSSHPVWTRRHRRLPRDFGKFAQPLRESENLAEGKFSGTPWMVLPVHALFQTVFQTLACSRNGTLMAGGAESPPATYSA